MGCGVTSAEVTIFPSPLARSSFSPGLCVLAWGLQDGMGPKGQVLVQKLVLSKGVEEIQIQKPSRKARRASHQLLPSEMRLLQSRLLPFLGGCWFPAEGQWEQRVMQDVLVQPNKQKGLSASSWCLGKAQLC